MKMGEVSYRGKILISNSSVVYDYFNKTVIFIVDHDSSGAFGLVLNKKGDLKLRDVIKDLPDFSGADEMVSLGGPVDQNFVSILFSNPTLAGMGGEVIPGVFIGRSYDLLLKLIETQSPFHIYQGYSGWGAGQLESEFERMSWVEHDAKKEFIFSTESSAHSTEELWKSALKSKGGIYKYFAEHIKDPMLN